MSPEEENISPEEKLLKVIQEDGKKPEEAAPQKVEQSAEAQDVKTAQPQAVDVQEAEPKESEKPLKLKPQDEAPQPSPEQSSTGEMIGQIGAGGALPVDQGSSFMDSMRRFFQGDSRDGRSKIFNVGIANKCLAAVILLATALVVWEIYAAVMRDSDALAHISGANQAQIQAGTPKRLPPLDQLLPLIHRRPNIWAFKSVISQTENGPKPAPSASWEEYVRHNIVLAGFHYEARNERDSLAALSDKKAKVSHFLQVGETFKVTLIDGRPESEVEIELRKIMSDRLILGHGEKQIDLAPKRGRLR